MEKVKVSEEHKDESVVLIRDKKHKWMTKVIAEQSSRDVFLHVTLSETILFTLFVMLTTCIVIGMVSSSMFYLTKILRDEFTEREFQTTNEKDIKFADVRAPSDFWAYLDHATSKSFYWDYWYDNENPIKDTEADDKSVIYENKLLGVPRLRQLKVRNDSCGIYDVFRKSITACYGAFSRENQDVDSFGAGDGTAWTYSSPEDIEGGGFYQDLTLSQNTTKEMLKKLKENLWITRGTRAVYLDFTVYNANMNLFCVVKITFEFPPTGGILPSNKFLTLKLIRYASAWDYFVLGLEIVFLCHLIYNTAEEVREIIYLKGNYFVYFWNYIDLVILLLGYICAVLAIFRYFLVEEILKQLESNAEKYVDFEQVAEIQLHFNNSLASLLFLIYMKIFKYITFNKMMAQLNNTIKNCANDIAGFSVMFFIIFVAFAELGHLMFGTQVESFSTFGVSMFTLLRTILGDFEYEQIEEVDEILAPIYFISFIILVFFILLNMFLAIINDTYTDVKTELTVKPEEMQVLEYLKRGYYNMLRCCKCRVASVPKMEMKNEFNVTVAEIRGALKKCGFTDLEIEMFFAKYNVDPTASVGNYTVDDLLKELQAQPKTTNAPDASTSQGNTQTADDGSPLVALDDFLEQQRKLDGIDSSIQELTQHVRELTDKLDKLENVRKAPIN